MADKKNADRPRRTGRPVNLYLDPATERRLRTIKQRLGLRSISAAVAELAQRAKEILT